MGISWSHCDSSRPVRLCYCSVVDAGWPVPFFPFSKFSFPPSSAHLLISVFFFFKEAKMGTGSSFHYLFSLVLVHLFINSFPIPGNLYTLFVLFRLEDFIGVVQYPLPFSIFAIYAQCSRLTEYLQIWCALLKFYSQIV